MTTTKKTTRKPKTTKLKTNSNELKISRPTIETTLNNENLKLNFKEYKHQSTICDVERMQKNLKPYVWENVPIFGCFAYMIRIALKNSDIDHGTLRREIVKYQIIFIFCLLPLFTLTMLITPWFLYMIHALAIKRTKVILNNNV